MKHCSKCGESKPLNEFHKSHHKRDGVVSQCKDCVKRKHASYYIANKGKLKLQHDKYHRGNKEKINEKSREYYQANKEKTNERVKIWQAENPDKVRKATIKWRMANRDKSCEFANKWRKENPEKVRLAKKSQYQRYKNDSSFVIAGRISNAMRYSLKNDSKANRHWESLVNFTVDQLKMHLEKLFKPGMTWENYGTAWHIDHKIPIAVFNFERPEDIDFKICWSLKNLQPLGASENMRKGAKIEKPFQPSLAMEMR